MIVVAAPTSRIGRHLLPILLDSDAQLRVIARHPDRLPAGVRQAAEVLEGSHTDPGLADQAFAGADAVFWLVPPLPDAPSLEAVYTDATRPAAEAFARHGVARVVGVSALGRGTSEAANAGHVTASLAMDDMVAASGVSYRALTLPSFMDNVVMQADAIAAGNFFSPITAGLKLPTCDTRDIAAVAARLLLDDTWTGVDEVPVLGPEDLSKEDLAATMSDVLGHEVRAHEVPAEQFKTNLLAGGMSEPIAQGMTDMFVAKNHGLDQGVERTAANSTPTTFRKWCEDVLVPTMTG